MNPTTVLHLSLIPGIGPAIIETMVARHQAALDITALHASDIQQLYGISARVAQLIVEGLAHRALLDAELARIERYKISWMTCFDSEYPECLKAIHLPPAVLYWRGVAPQRYVRSIAVVGSRKANAYGERVVRMLIPALVAHGWSVISGGALGIDSCAHRSTLDVQGRTMAVIGSGLLSPYPVHNERLFEQIVSCGGTLLSSFSLTAVAQAGNFPARNRIIAGMSSGCVVVQAAARSGALITAQCALNEGREVFAVPGPIDDPLSHGCHRLLSQGAHVVQIPDDILAVLGGELAVRMPQRQENPWMHVCPHPVAFDELLALTRYTPGELQEKLFEAQLSGLIKQDGAGLWSVC